MRSRAWFAANPNIGQTVVAFAIRIAGAALSFLLNLMIARTFGPIGVGAFGLMVTTLTLASTASLVGLDYVLIRVVAGDLREGARGAARGAVGRVAAQVFVNAGIAALVTAFVIAPLIARFTGDAAAVAVLEVTAWGVVPIAMMRVVASALRGSGRVQLGQILDGPLSTGLAMAALALWLLIGSPHVAGAGQLYVGAIGLAVLAGGLVSWRDMRGWGAAPPTQLGPMIRGGWKILLVVLSGYGSDWLILTGLARYASTADVGLFRTAWQVAALFNLLVVAFDAVGGPRIAAAWRVGDRQAIARISRQSSFLMVLLSLPLLLLCFIMPEWLLSLFGPRFPAAATALRILAAGQLFNLATGAIGSVLIMTGHERLSMIYSLVAVAAAAALMPLFGPTLGLTGAALVSAGILVFRKLSALFLVYRIIRAESPTS